MRLIPMTLALAVALALFAVGGVSARPQATSIQIRTVLNAAQEVPTPTGAVANAGGTFTATVTKSDAGASVSWQLSFTGLTGNAIAAHIHTGAVGSPGPVVLALCGPCTSPGSGTGTLSQTALEALESGNAYVNVHTPTNPGGEIRGQLETTATATTTLNARQEVPRPKGNVKRATGNFTAVIKKAGTTGTMAWRLRFSKLTGPAIAAHLHIGRVGRAGPVAVALCGPCRSGRRGTADLSPAVLVALETGRAYVNVHTRKNPGGEIRGQIRPVSLTIS